MARIRISKPEDNPRILQIWRDAVEATHHFVTSEDRRDIELEVASFIPHVTFDLAVDEANSPLAFMLIDNAHMEALFVDPACHGWGIGRILVEDAIRRHSELTTDVNEQNTLAIGFYEKLAFERCGRSELDGQGRPYPLIHLRYGSSRPKG